MDSTSNVWDALEKGLALIGVRGTALVLFPSSHAAWCPPFEGGALLHDDL